MTGLSRFDAWLAVLSDFQDAQKNPVTLLNDMVQRSKKKLSFNDDPGDKTEKVHSNSDADKGYTTYAEYDRQCIGKGWGLNKKASKRVAALHAVAHLAARGDGLPSSLQPLKEQVERLRNNQGAGVAVSAPPPVSSSDALTAAAGQLRLVPPQAAAAATAGGGPLSIGGVPQRQQHMHQQQMTQPGQQQMTHFSHQQVGFGVPLISTPLHSGGVPGPSRPQQPQPVVGAGAPSRGAEQGVNRGEQITDRPHTPPYVNRKRQGDATEQHARGSPLKKSRFAGADQGQHSPLLASNIAVRPHPRAATPPLPSNLGMAFPPGPHLPQPSSMPMADAPLGGNVSGRGSHISHRGGFSAPDRGGYHHPWGGISSRGTPAPLAGRGPPPQGGQRGRGQISQTMRP